MPDEPVTQDQDVDQPDQPAGDTPPADEGGDKGGVSEPFLVVNDRTRYETREEALKAYNAAGERISQLTPYAEITERYGISDPSTLMDILDDYRALRTAASRQVNREDKGAAPADTAADTLAGLDPKDRQNVDYLRKLGFSPAEALLKTVNERLSKLESGYNDRLAQAEQRANQLGERQQNEVIESGRSYLGTLMDEKKLPNDPELAEVLENSITAWIENQSYDAKGRLIPGSPAERFMRGGRSMQATVVEGFDKVLSAMNKMRISADAQYQDKKNGKVRSTAKPLPKDGSPNPTEKTGTERKFARRPGAGGIFQDPAVHDKAFDLMQRGSGDTE